MSPNSSHKITPDHLSRQACLYIRQSSLHQVQHNKESQIRQYNLKHRAIALGWSADQMDIIDEDQGKSGATSTHRQGFQDLRARVGAGEVGILLCLEVSRLCRNNAEWSQLLQMAAITNTLILDEQGVYDASDPNDGLLLGIKGQLSEFELAGIRARMVGGQRNKAQRGELKLPLPVGLIYTGTEDVVKDPDRSIAQAITQVFRTFQKLGSAMQVTKWFVKQGILFPSRAIGSHSEVYWTTPTHSQIRRILHNPRYAGCYAYGRTARKTRPDGTIQHQTLPREKWLVCIPDAHEGYISWDEYLQNQKTMQKNRASFFRGAERVPSPRKGVALLQSRILCGRCGHRMRVQYSHSRGQTSWYYVCKEEVVRRGKRMCQSMRGDLLDAAVGNFIIAAVNRENLALSLIIRDELRTDFEEADRLRENRIEGLHYQENLARRRYMAVDPSNRLVSATLEADWNQHLKTVQEAVQEREKYAQQYQQMPDAELDARILQLANDFGLVWKADATTNEDRKRLLSLLIEDITLLRDGYQVEVKLRLRGGRTQELPPVDLPRPRATVIRRDASPEVLAELEILLEEVCNDRVAAQKLNQRGHRDSRGDPFTRRSITRIRNRHNMKTAILRKQEQLQKRGYRSGRVLAAELDMSHGVLQRRAKHGQGIKAHRIQVGKRTFVMYKITPKSQKSNPSDR